MKILVLDGRIYFAQVTKEGIEEYFSHRGIFVDVTVANSIIEANIEIGIHQFDYIICDLNLNPFGLNEDYYSETLGAVLTGWVWAEHYIFEANINSRIIIYSDFVDELAGLSGIDKYASQIAVFDRSKSNVEDICGKILTERL